MQNKKKYMIFCHVIIIYYINDKYNISLLQFVGNTKQF